MKFDLDIFLKVIGTNDGALSLFFVLFQTMMFIIAIAMGNTLNLFICPLFAAFSSYVLYKDYQFAYEGDRV